MGAQQPGTGVRAGPRHVSSAPVVLGQSRPGSNPVNPQRRVISQVVELVREGGLIVYPTDSCFALGCQLGNSEGLHRIRQIRDLDDKHHFTLVCRDFAQLGQFVHISNRVFRLIKASTPGSYTFILPATKEVPRRLLRPKKKTVGVPVTRPGSSSPLSPPGYRGASTVLVLGVDPIAEETAL